MTSEMNSAWNFTHGSLKLVRYQCSLTPFTAMSLYARREIHERSREKIRTPARRKKVLVSNKTKLRLSSWENSDNPWESGLQWTSKKNRHFFPNLLQSPCNLSHQTRRRKITILNTFLSTISLTVAELLAF